jgi:hypothetical protein
MIDGLNGYLRSAPAHSRGLDHRPILGSLSIIRRLLICTNNTRTIECGFGELVWIGAREGRPVAGELVFEADFMAAAET